MSDTTFLAGTPITVNWFTTTEDLQAFALGPIHAGSLHYAVVSNGEVITYRANDSNGIPTIDTSRAPWGVSTSVIHALYRETVAKYAQADAEDRRWREVQELRAQLENARLTNNRETIMREMMERAAEIAESEGFCSEYDRLAAALGYEGRERDWVVNVEIEAFTVQVHVRATSEETACDSVEESEVDDAIRSFISNNSVSWSTDSAERD